MEPEKANVETEGRENSEHRPEGETALEPVGAVEVPETDGGASGENEVSEVVDPVLSRPLLDIPQGDTVESAAGQEPGLGSEQPLPPNPAPATKKRGLLSGCNWGRYDAGIKR